MSFFSFRKRKFFWQKVLVELASKWQIALLGPTAGGLAARWIRSVAGGYFRKEVQAHLMHVEILQVPVIAHYPFDNLYPIKFRRSKAFDAVHLYEFRDIWVSPNSALVELPGNLVLEESAGSLEKVLSWGKILPELLIPKHNLPVKGPVLVIPSAPFYHFVWEHLPVIVQALSHKPDARLLLTVNPPRYVTDYLTLLLGAGWKDRAIFSNKMCKVFQLLVPQIESFSGFIHPAYPQILRNAYAHVVEGATPGIDRIYISRRVAPGRLMRHEEELERALITLGFKILFLEKMTVEEQMRAFASAYMIVGPHGAGLSHIHFSQAGAYVLEFFPDSYFNDCYARLAVGLGHTYDHLTCKYDADWEGGMLPIDNILVRVKERIQAMEPANSER